jgi:hypothetical protein
VNEPDIGWPEAGRVTDETFKPLESGEAPRLTVRELPNGFPTLPQLSMTATCAVTVLPRPNVVQLQANGQPASVPPEVVETIVKPSFTLLPATTVKLPEVPVRAPWVAVSVVAPAAKRVTVGDPKQRLLLAARPDHDQSRAG